MKFIEETLVPLAAKIGSERHLVAIRDGFTTVMPLTIAGAVGVLLLCIGGLFDANGLNMPAVMNGYNSFIETTGLKLIFSAMNGGTIGVMAILVSAMVPSVMARNAGGDGLAAAAIGISSFMCGLGINADMAFNAGLRDANGLFVAMLVGLFVGQVFPALAANEKLKITMPDGVPPAVANAFSSLIPAIITLVLVGAIYGYTFKFTGMTFFEVITKFIQTPITGLSQGIGMIIICYGMIGLLWCFGLHGANIVGSVTSPILTPLSLDNVAKFAAGEEPQYTVVGEVQSGFAFLGGSGATIGCIIAIFLFSKSKAAKTIAKLATAPGIFEINEPLTFGLPIVLNVILAIPFILGPVILGVVTYFLMEGGLLHRCCIQAPWVTPPILIGFLCTGGDVKGAIWNVIEIVLLTVLWTPFIIMNDKQSAE